jgi:hypothetical protein
MSELWVAYGCTLWWHDVPLPQHFPAGHAAHCAHPPVVSVLADLPETLPEMRQRLGDSSDSDRKSWLWHALAVTNRWTLQNTSKYIKIK